MKQKILQFITSILLIITLTISNFFIICIDVVSYAVDAINIDKSTNHKNIEFMAYFKDENGNRITEKDIATNSDNLKLYFQISVKKEGYLNGNIVLDNANFVFNTDMLIDSVNRIENNIIYLNQINASETKEIEVDIELLKNDQFDLDLIDLESKISIKGIYRDSTQKDISINAERNVSLNLISLYTAENLILSQNIITNKILKINGKNKRIIQIEIESGLKDNLFPVKSSTINVKIPKISDIYPENILVNSNNILVTNGEKISNDNWKYNKETGLITINIENKEKDGKVSWIKNGTDNIIITYMFDENVKIKEEKILANAEIRLYDTNNTLIEASNEKILNNDEIDSIVTSEIIQNETSIYKGNLYAGISRDITYKNIINVNLNNVADVINVKEDRQTIGKQSLKSVYKMTKIDKSNIDDILGENGKLNIINAENEAIISTIDKDTKSNDNGNIIVMYPENVETIKIEIIDTDKIGRLEMESTKVISSNSRDVIKSENIIMSKSSVSYILDNEETKLSTIESIIDLKETETSVDLEISRTELSAMTTNNNVEFRITLNSNKEKDELFKNPVLRLEFPDKIEKIDVNSINLLYEDELKIKSAVLNNKSIEIVFNGEQTKYKEEAINGSIVLINANLTTSKKIPSSTEQVKLTYTNEKAINYKDDANVIRNIDIVSYAGLVTTNQISEYGIELVNNNGVETAELAVSDNTKNVTINKKIINNKENKISNVQVLGTFPTKDAININNIDIEVGKITVSGIDISKVKVYYSDNELATKDIEKEENKWKDNIENSKNVKKYLVVIDELELFEELDLYYEISIPSNLEYNESAEEGYTVYYNNMTVEEQVNTKPIRLATPAGTVVETTLKSLVAGREVNKIKENEVLRYELVVENIGSERVSNVKIEAEVPEGTTFVNSYNLNNEIDVEELEFIDKDKKRLEFNIESLASGEKVTKYYEVQINEGMENKEINNNVTTYYGEVSKISNEVSTLVEKGNIELKFVSVDAKDNIVKSGYQYRYVLYITNKSNKNMKDLEVSINKDEILDISEIYYINSNDRATIVENTSNIKISNITAGETIEVAIYTTVSIFKDVTSKNVSISAIVNNNKDEYNSNEVNLVAKSNLLLNLSATSENSGAYVKAGDIIKYNVVIKNEGSEATNLVTLNNWISNDVTLTKVMRNGIKLSENNYSLKIDNNKHQKVLEIIDSTIKAGENIEYQIEVVVNLLYGNTSAIEIISEYALEVNAQEIETAKLSHILKPESISNGQVSGNEDSNGENDSNEGNGDNLSSPEETSGYKIISGVAWIDENEDGQKGITEKAIEGIVVKLLDTTTNKFLKDLNGNVMTAVTTSTGFYSFSKVEKGQYLVIFEYDNTKYGLTKFEKDGISNEVNSNVITKNINVDGLEQQVAATEIININDNNVSNINIGLIAAKKYDLQLNKYISKVTVQNDKTATNTYKDSSLVKQEIDAKQVNSTIIIVEYTIKVTNNGDISAYVKKIVDYLSNDYKFSSELNRDWYQSGSDVYCTSLANEELKPGDSKEVTLTVIKEMNENNTGLINNTAEIVNSYNELGLKDINSTENNRIKGENDMSSADLIISIKTGQVVMTFTFIILSVAVLAIAVILYTRKILRIF